jgi:hypothetical protein
VDQPASWSQFCCPRIIGKHPDSGICSLQTERGPDFDAGPSFPGSEMLAADNPVRRNRHESLSIEIDQADQRMGESMTSATARATASN